MVDLAKIRKKAKAQKEEAAKIAAPDATAPVAPPVEKAGHGRGRGHGRGTEGKELAQAPSALNAEEPRPPIAPPPADDRATAKLERFRETAGRLTKAVAAPAAAAEAAPEEGKLELLTFVMAGEQYAIDIERIAEIIAPRPVTPVPNAPPPVVGIISLRGTIVTMLDLRRELGHGAAGAVTAETRTIVVEDSGSLAGFTVDRVLRVVKVRPEQVQPHPVVSP
ncbi:MAG TPA: chemotaxis protein CheW, partial [Thermoanaerobaculia bacterium]